MAEDSRRYDEKPQWFIDEMRELRIHIDGKASNESVEHIKETQSSIIKYGISVIVAGVVSIGGLYALYYSGLADLKTQVEVMDSKLSAVKDDVTNIKATLSSAQITR